MSIARKLNENATYFEAKNLFFAVLNAQKGENMIKQLTIWAS